MGIPCIFMRGGTSRGPYFRAEDLPADTATRDRVLLAAHEDAGNAGEVVHESSYQPRR